MSMRLGDR